MNTLQQQETKAILAMAEYIKKLEEELAKARKEILDLKDLLTHKWENNATCKVQRCWHEHLYLFL